MSPAPAAARTRAVALALALALALAAAAAAGCRGPQSAPPSDKLPSWERPDALFLAPEPCDALVIEVDSTVDAPPSDAALDALRSFFAAYCEKPAGISIVRDESIPAESVRGLTPERIALRHMSLAPDPRDRATAYVYVLYYRSDDGRNPHVNWHYPGAIFADITYFRRVASEIPGFAVEDVEAPLLVHEAGHVLGLTRDESHGDGSHCSNRRCVMYAVLEVSLEGLSRGERLPEAPCDRCRADIAAARSRRPDARLGFVGPVFVRREPRYTLLRLPGLLMVALGDEAAIPAEIRGRALAARAEIYPAEAQYLYLYWRPPEAAAESLAGPLGDALRDPDAAARHAAAILLRDLASAGPLGPRLDALRRLALDDVDPGVRSIAESIPESAAPPDTAGGATGRSP